MQVVQSKYKCGNDIIPKINFKHRGLNIWSGIKATWEKVKAGMEEINDGNSVSWRGEKMDCILLNQPTTCYLVVAHVQTRAGTRSEWLEHHSGAKPFSS